MVLFKPIYVVCLVGSLGSIKVGAQIERGNYTVGGTLNFHRISRGPSPVTTRIGATGMYGSLLTDHVMFGGQAEFSANSYTGRLYRSINVGPFLRYYFSNKIFLHGDISYGFPSGYLFTYSRCGYAWFLNNHVALEPYLFAGCYGSRNDVLNLLNDPGNRVSFDYGLYFSLQVYLESRANRQLRGKNPMVPVNKKGLHN